MENEPADGAVEADHHPVRTFSVPDLNPASALPGSVLVEGELDGTTATVEERQPTDEDEGFGSSGDGEATSGSDDGPGLLVDDQPLQPAAHDLAGTSVAHDVDDAQDADVLDLIEAELSDVEVALTRLDEGTYGTCEVCGRAIDDERLRDAPAARHCADHLPLTLG